MNASMSQRSLMEMARQENFETIHVLHVDDDLGHLQISKEMLESFNMIKVDVAASVDEAILKLGQEEYDVIVSDYQMPGKDGLQFLKELLERKTEIPFILFTGKGREEVAISALNLGADGYFNKQGDTETVYGELSHGIRLAAERRRVKIALEESEKRYRSLMEQAAEAIFIHDKTGRLLDANRMACNNLGYTKEELLSMHISDIDPEATVDKKGAVWPAVLAGQTFTFEGSQTRKDGSTFPVEVTVSSMPLGKEKVVIGLVRDITDRKKAEERLEKEQQDLDCIVDSSPIIIFYKDKEGKFIRVNKTFAEMLKIPKEEFLGKTVYDFYSADIAQAMTNDDTEVIKSGRPKLGIIERYESASGIRWVQTDKVPIFDKNGTPVGLVGFSQDITERKKAEQEVREQKEKAERYLNIVGSIILAVDMQGKITLMNKRANEILGYKEGELKGKDLIEICIPAESRKDWRNASEAWILGKAKTIEHLESLVLTKNGEKRIVSWNNTELRDADDHLMGVLCSGEDVTERKKAEEELQKLNRSLRALANSNQALIHAVDEATYAKKVCDIIVQDCGYVLAWVGFAEQDEEKTVRPFTYTGFDKNYVDTLNVSWADNERGRGPTGRAIRTGKTQVRNILTDPNYSSRRKAALKRGYISSIAFPLITDGKAFGALSIYNKEPTFSDDEVKLLTELADDFAQGIITLRLRSAKQHADEAMEMQASLIDLSPDPIIVKKIDGTITFWSKGAEKLYGWSKIEAVGQDAHVLLKTKYSEPFVNIIQKFYSLGYWSGELLQQTKDGHKITVQSQWQARVDAKNKKTDIMESNVDITERKKSEQELKESRDKVEIMNEKLRVTGGLTRHDIRNKLAAIEGYLHIARKRLATGDDPLPNLAKVESNIEKIVRIFEFARAYEKIGVEKLIQVDVEKAIQDAVSFFPEQENVTIDNYCHGLSVLADSLLDQVFYNLIDNSLKHGKKTSRIKINFQENNREQLRIIYEDDGVGIPAAEKSNLFKEGYSTVGGTGYGLYLIGRIIRFYGWTIQETGETGKGIRFILTIPKKEQGTDTSYILPQKPERKNSGNN